MRRDVALQPGPLRGAAERVPGALPGEAGTPLVEEQGGGASSGRRQDGSRSDQVGVEGGHRIRAQGDEPLLVALAEQPDTRRLVEVDVVDVEADRLGDAGARAVEHLEEGSV